MQVSGGGGLKSRVGHMNFDVARRGGRYQLRLPRRDVKFKLFQ